MHPPSLVAAMVIGAAVCTAQQGASTGGSLDGWTWKWGGPHAVSQGSKPGQGLCLSSPPLDSTPCPATTAPSGQCATAVRDVPSNFVSVVLERSNAQQQIGLHTADKCSDRELWEFVYVCETNGDTYCGRGPGWKVTPCGATAKAGDTMQLRRVGDTVSYELCPAKPQGAPCKVHHTETMVAATPNLYAHVGIHNIASAVELCHLQPVASASWGWSFLLGMSLMGVAYVGGGTYIGWHAGRGDRTARAALQRHPHWTKWQGLVSLVHDGVSYSRGYVKGRRTATIADAAYEPVLKQASSPGKRRKGSKTKKNSRETNGETPASASASPTSCNVEGASSGSNAGAARASDHHAAVDTGEDGAKSAAAGGGGRWVHVPG